MFVFSNLAISLDGKIGVASRAHFYLGTKEDRLQMQALRKKCDAIIMGATTIRAFKKACVVKDAPQGNQPVNVIVSRGLEGFDPEWSFFTDARIGRVLFVSEKLPSEQLALFEKTSKVILISKEKPLAPQICEALKKEGIKNLLVEGGGELMWEFASQNLIDEYNVTLTPKIVGGREAPTLVEGKGFEPADILSLKLKESRKLGDELYLVYSKV